MLKLPPGSNLKSSICSMRQSTNFEADTLNTDNSSFRPVGKLVRFRKSQQGNRNSFASLYGVMGSPSLTPASLSSQERGQLSTESSRLSAQSTATSQGNRQFSAKTSAGEPSDRSGGGRNSSRPREAKAASPTIPKSRHKSGELGVALMRCSGFVIAVFRL